MESLYSILEQQKNDTSPVLPEREYYKSSLVGLSHAVEDVVMNLNLHATLFVTFQRFEFFLDELERYQKLAQTCQNIYIFCHGIEKEKIKEFYEKFTNVKFIEISPTSPLAREWHIIVSHQEYPMMFVAKEVILSEQDEMTREYDEFRTFKGYFDFIPERVDESVKFFCDQLSIVGKDIPTIDSCSLTDSSINFLNNFINNSLLLLEDQNRDLLEITKNYTKFKTDMENMKKIHDRFLPRKSPAVPGLDIESFYAPANQVGSDFYQYIQFENKLVFYITDVTGHGFDGALINIFIRETIKNSLLSFSKQNEISAEKIMNELAQSYVIENFPHDQFACVLIGVIDTENLVTTISNAGIETPPLLCDNREMTSELPVKGLPLTSAVDSDMLIYDQNRFTLTGQDLLLISSDGINQGQQFSNYEKMKQILVANKELSSQEIVHNITSQLLGVSSHEESLELSMEDDVTLISIKIESNRI